MLQVCKTILSQLNGRSELNVSDGRTDPGLALIFLKCKVDNMKILDFFTIVNCKYKELHHTSS